MRVFNVAAEGSLTSGGGSVSRTRPVSHDKKVAKHTPDESIAAKMTDALLRRGLKIGATAVHLEPQTDGLQIRYRIAGNLSKPTMVPKKAMVVLLPYLKALAHVPHHDSAVPQHGQFSFPVQNTSFSVKLSTLPVVDGEKIVLHFVNESQEIPTLEALGYSGQALQTLSHAITQPGGLVLVTGPADSGKSLSLYSIASELNKVGTNVTTIEESVNHTLKGVNQFRINEKAGLTAIRGLQAALRQDPDVIMLDGVHDTPTAELATQSAAARHLVFSTMYADNAASGIIQLLSRGIEPFLIASSLRTSTAQRLLHRLCQHCKQPYTVDKYKNDSILHSLAIKAAKLNKDSKLWQASSRGCAQCNHSGYQGRIGAYEVMPISPTIQKLIMGNAVASSINDHAIKEGMTPLIIDALQKASAGHTTIEEVFRVAHTIPSPLTKTHQYALQ